MKTQKTKFKALHDVRSLLALSILLGAFFLFAGAGKASAATNVFYSVGQNTNDHKTGSPSITLSGYAATLSVGQTAPNMGVGDVITYAGGSCFISAKTDADQMHWNCQNATGGTAPQVTDATVTSINHAFSSLSVAVGGASPGAANSSHLNTSNLTAGDYILKIPCYYDTGSDTTAVSINDWTTGASNYIEIYTPTSMTTEVNQTQRHSGVWDDSKYHLNISSTVALYIQEDHVKAHGLQLNAVGYTGIRISVGDDATINIADNIVKGNATTYVNAIYVGAAGPSSFANIWNNIIYGFNGTEGYCFYVYDVDITAHLYNNTCSGNAAGIYARSGTVVAKNNIVKGSGNAYSYNGIFATGTNANSTDSTDSPGVGTNYNEQTFTFNDEANKDYHLNSGDTGAKNKGENLSADDYFPFSDDIDGDARAGSWDIGADEVYSSDVTAPTIDTFSIPSTATSLTVSIDSLTAHDNVAVTGYLVNESASTPSASDLAWSGTAPTSYTFSSDGAKTLYAWAKDAAGNVSSSLNDSVTITLPDITPPVRSVGSPSGSQYSGTTQVTLSLTTNENATCKYSTSSGTSYDAMTNTFSTTGTTSHSQIVSGLSDGQSYSYYVRCIDGSSNPNTDDYMISFSILSSETTKENLEEIFMRKDRQATNTFYSGEGSSPYYWQPQTMMYKDITTNHEVWKLSNTRAGVSHIYYDDIAMQPWSADGKRLAYTQVMSSAQGMSTSAYSNEEGWKAWFISNTDGSESRPTPNSPIVCNGPAVFPWSPINPDVFHWFGETHCGNSSALSDTLYEGTVSDASVSRSALFSLGTGTGMKFFSNSFSADGTKAMATQSYLADRFSYKIWPITLYPTPSIDVADGYTTGRPHDSTYWGSSPDVWSTAHSGNVPLINRDGSGNYWYYWVDSYASGTGFLTKLTGSEADGGAGHTVDHSGPWTFSDFGENVPIMVGGEGNNPWSNGHYWSHPAFDRWGKYVAYSDSDDPTPYGLSVEDVSAKSRIITKQGGSGNQHNVWTGWTDYVVSTRGAGSDVGCSALGYSTDAKYSADRIFTKKYNDNSNFTELVRTHTLYNNSDGCYAGAGYEYPSIPRPGQSPDGTKVAFHSTFTTKKSGDYDSHPDIFWTVAYYPYAPEIISANASAGTVSVSFNWRTDQATSRGYTQRGWPDESTDDPPPPRETKEFRLWRSTDKINWTPLGTSNADIFTRYNFSNGTWNTPYSASSAWTITDAPGNGTFYYMVTSVEWSGLESHSSSNIYAVTVSGGSGSGLQDTSYPSDPGRLSNPGSSGIQTSFSNTKTSLIRAYNIYAHDGSAPSVRQEDLITTIPQSFCSSGSCHYVDWLGNPNGTTQYFIAAVDTQGNISNASFVTSQASYSYGSGHDSDVTPAMSASGQYLITWDDKYESGGPTSDSTPPTITTFSIPETSTSVTVPITTFTASDDIGVTGYLLTESATSPDADDPEWSETAPTEYVFSSEGTKNLYAWAKDASGNISSSLSDSVTITLPTYTIGGTMSGLTGTAVLQNNGGDDLTVSSNGSFTFGTALHDSDTYGVIVSDQPEDQTCTVTNGTGTVSGANVTNISVTCEDGADSTPPTVTAFSIPLTSDSLTIAITEFTATDDTAVTGYLLNELSSAPSAADSGWEVTAPTEYTFLSDGAKTLYAWAKDGSGNVSESLNASIAVVPNAQVAGVNTKRKDDHKRDLDVHSVKFSSTATTFTVTWKTDYKANSKVKYGFTKEPKIKKKSSKRKKSHSITIKNLLPDRVYYFKASSTDQYGNEDKSKVYMVRTAKLWQWQR